MDLKHRGGFRTDQPGVVPTDILSDDSLKTIQAKMAYRQPLPIEEIQKTTAKKAGKVAETEKLEQPKMLRFSSLNLIPKDFAPLGTGMYKKGHHLWSLSKEGDSFVLLRAQEEQFDEEEEMEEDEDNENGEEELGDAEDDNEKEAQPKPLPEPVGDLPLVKRPVPLVANRKRAMQASDAEGNVFKDGDEVAMASGAGGRYTVEIDPMGQIVYLTDIATGEDAGAWDTSDVVKVATHKKAQAQYSPEIVSDVMNVLATYSIYLTDEGARDYIHQFRNANPDAKLEPGVVARWINEKRGGNGMFATRKKAEFYSSSGEKLSMDDLKQWFKEDEMIGGESFDKQKFNGWLTRMVQQKTVNATGDDWVKYSHRKKAVDSTAKNYYKSYFKEYGKALTENKLELVAPIVARAYFKMMGRTMPQTLWSNRPKWAMLEKKYGNSLVKDVRSWLGEGITQIRIATVMNVRPEVALLWKPVIDKLGTKTARELRKRIIAGRRFAHSYPVEIMKSAAKAVHGERKLAHRKVAVDEATKEYYKQYYGMYGETLVRNVRDVIMEAPKAQ